MVGCELEYIQEPVRSRVFKSTNPAIQFFVKLHIEENGELEVFAIGLQKVPIKWVKDPNFVDRHARRRKTFDPSWSLNHPSKWIPKNPAKNQDPRIIDYVCIPKRRIKKASLETNVSGGPLNSRYFEFE